MRYSNFHTHTIFSDGNNTMEEMIKAAIDLNFISLGISDHSFTQHDRRYCMRRPVEAAYVREFNRLKEIYGDKIDLYLGLELDGSSEIDFRDKLDYVVGDCHYVYANKDFHSVDHKDSEQMDAVERYWQNDYMYYAKTYFETYAKEIVRMKPDILGHFDLCCKYIHCDEESKEYMDYAVKALEQCKTVCDVLEINTKAFGYPCAHPFPKADLIKVWKDMGGRVTLSGDSHSVDKLTYCFEEGKELIKSLGYKSIAILHNHQMEDIDLD